SYPLCLVAGKRVVCPSRKGSWLPVPKRCGGPAARRSLREGHTALYPDRDLELGDDRGEACDVGGRERDDAVHHGSVDRFEPAFHLAAQPADFILDFLEAAVDIV